MINLLSMKLTNWSSTKSIISSRFWSFVRPVYLDNIINVLYIQPSVHCSVFAVVSKHQIHCRCHFAIYSTACAREMFKQMQWV